MGTSSSAVRAAKLSAKLNKAIEVQLEKDSRTFEETLKLLLLGAAESGKSTTLKQMRILNADQFSQAELTQLKCAIRGNVLASIVALINGMKQLKLNFTDTERREDADLIMREADSVNQCDAGTVLDAISAQVSAAIERVWRDASVQVTLSRSNEFQLIDSAQFFLNNVKRIASASFVPTQEDILMTRRPTTAIVETKFRLRNKPFLQKCRNLFFEKIRVVDVGGQQSQRRKWIHCFENVHAILFIAAISEYNQQLREEESTNRLLEAVRLFTQMINSRWFKNSQMIVFLNKIDIFKQKIQSAPITTAFPNYKGTQDCEECLQYIEEQFRKRNKVLGKAVYIHRTCATDTRQMSYVLDSSIDFLVKATIKGAALS